MRGDGDELLAAEDAVDHLAHRGLGNHLGRHSTRSAISQTARVQVRVRHTCRNPNPSPAPPELALILTPPLPSGLPCASGACGRQEATCTDPAREARMRHSVASHVNTGEDRALQLVRYLHAVDGEHLCTRETQGGYGCSPGYIRLQPGEILRTRSPRRTRPEAAQLSATSLTSTLASAAAGASCANQTCSADFGGGCGCHVGGSVLPASASPRAREARPPEATMVRRGRAAVPSASAPCSDSSEAA